MSEQSNTIPIRFVDTILGFSRAIQRASNGKSSLHHIYKNEYSNDFDFAYAIIRLFKITTRNEKGLTARGTMWKFLYGPKQILPESSPGWHGCGYATATHHQYFAVSLAVEWRGEPAT